MPPRKAFPGLPLPKPHQQCPGCLGWFTYNSQSRFLPLNSHWYAAKNDSACRLWHVDHPDDPARSIPVYYACQIFPPDPKRAHSLFRARFSDDYKPPNHDIPVHHIPPVDLSPVLVVLPEYLAKWGWTSYVEGLDANVDMLLYLISMPSMQHVE